GLRLAARQAGSPRGVGIGRIDGVEAGGGEAVEQLEGARLVGGPAEYVAAEDQRCDVEAGAAKGTFVHWGTPPGSSDGLDDTAFDPASCPRLTRRRASASSRSHPARCGPA